MPNNPSANFSAWSRRKRAGASSQNWRPTFIIEGAGCLERVSTSLSDSRMSLDHDALPVLLIEGVAYLEPNKLPAISRSARSPFTQSAASPASFG